MKIHQNFQKIKLRYTPHASTEGNGGGGRSTNGHVK